MISSASSLTPESSQTTRSPLQPLADEHPSLFAKGCLAIAFLIPLKLSLAYCALVPLVLYWLYTAWTEKTPRPSFPAPLQQLLTPLVFFMLAVAVSGVTGIAPLHSLKPMASLFFFALSIPLFALHARPLPTLCAVVAGQTIAALHSVVDGTFPNAIPSFFLGKVTESGQLAVTFFIALGLFWREAIAFTNPTRTAYARAINIVGLLTAAALALACFRNELGSYSTLILVLSLGWSAAALFISGVIAAKDKTLSMYRWIAVVVLPLLTAALLVNLKRGPWLGVLIGTTIFCAFYARRSLIAIAAVAVTIVATLPPIQERLAASYEDFTISGGRSTIWRIGAELTIQYPLGVGYRNSGVLRKFANEIPEELDHFHNNLLNITAENGWAATLLFLWFVVTAVRLCTSKPRDPLLVAIGCALVSWQCAGLVEYNAGDAEVLIVVWIALGVAINELTRKRSAREESQSIPACVAQGSPIQTALSTQL